jgi:hypothetical protein
VWELANHAYCPVIGVCLPIAALRRLVDKQLGGRALADDYELHCGVIADCKQRTPMAEAVQRELDRRYAGALQASARTKTGEALAAWWSESLNGKDVAGALWATLTHPRCDTLLEERVLRDIHMLQHQVGAADRADQRRLAELTEANERLARELVALQQRSTQQAAEQARKLEQTQAQALQLRAELISRDTTIAALREELQRRDAAEPGLKSRFELARLNERQLERIRTLERELAQSQIEAERGRQRALELETSLAASHGNSGDDPLDDGKWSNPPAPQLNERAVLCVGGRQASVPVYRRLIEDTGGRFLHHDGGEEDNVAKLDSGLAAADLVICQTGCISHDAYWRVKDHCKRTGKRCLFVDNPSTSSLRRALCTLSPPTREAVSPAEVPAG